MKMCVVTGCKWRRVMMSAVELALVCKLGDGSLTLDHDVDNGFS